MSKPKIISVSIDVTLLKKELFRPGNKPNKENKTPQFVTLDVLLHRDGPKFDNDYYVKQSNYVKDQPKEQRAEMPIIGNAKIVVGADSGGPQRSQRRSTSAPAATKPKGDDDDGEDVPF